MTQVRPAAPLPGQMTAAALQHELQTKQGVLLKLVRELDWLSANTEAVHGERAAVAESWNNVRRLLRGAL